jgi:glycosyltransferase involved in cell wall biosynthesis
MQGSKLEVLMVSRGVVPIRADCGGAERVTYELARHLAAAGHHVTLVADVEGAALRPLAQMDIVQIESLLAARLRDGRASFARWVAQHLVGNITASGMALRLLRRNRYDVVHCHGNLSCVLLSSLSRLPVVYTEHDATPWQCRYRRWWERGVRKAIYGFVNAAAFRRARVVVATFENLREQIITRWAVDEDRVVTINNGVDLDRFHSRTDLPVPQGARARARLFIRFEKRLREARNGSQNGSTPNGSTPNGRPHPFDRYCLYVGQLVSRKAPDLLLRALASDHDIRCVFAGDGPMRKELEALADELGIAHRVAFLGNRDADELVGLYAGADLLVLPSVSEASPLVVAEAMAAGTPVLATRISGVPTLVEDWETGFLISPANAGELGVAIRFLMHDDQLRERMAHRAQEKVQNGFAWSGVAEAYDHAYRATLPASRFGGQDRARVEELEKVAA